jgi:hypothetical protein
MLDFEVIKTDDTTKLVVVDLSDWTGLTGSELDVLLPECETPETVSINRNLVNSIGLGDLSITEDRLPDGVYTLTLKDSGTTVKEKKYLRTTYLRLQRDRVFLKYIEDCHFEQIICSKLGVIDLYLDSAYANLKDGDAAKANYYYNQAKARVDELLKCK